MPEGELFRTRVLLPELGCFQAGDSGARARAAESRRLQRNRGGGGGGLAAGWLQAGCRQAASSAWPDLRADDSPSIEAGLLYSWIVAEPVGEASPCSTVARGVREYGCVARTHCCAVVRAETGDSSLRRSIESRKRSVAAVLRRGVRCRPASCKPRHIHLSGH